MDTRRVGQGMRRRAGAPSSIYAPQLQPLGADEVEARGLDSTHMSGPDCQYAHLTRGMLHHSDCRPSVDGQGAGVAPGDPIAGGGDAADAS